MRLVPANTIVFTSRAVSLFKQGLNGAAPFLQHKSAPLSNVFSHIIYCLFPCACTPSRAMINKVCNYVAFESHITISYCAAAGELLLIIEQPWWEEVFLPLLPPRCFSMNYHHCCGTFFYFLQLWESVEWVTENFYWNPPPTGTDGKENLAACFPPLQPRFMNT